MKVRAKNTREDGVRIFRQLRAAVFEAADTDDDMPALEDEFGCDPWDAEHFDTHAATEDTREQNRPAIARKRVEASRW